MSRIHYDPVKRADPQLPGTEDWVAQFLTPAWLTIGGGAYVISHSAAKKAAKRRALAWQVAMLRAQGKECRLVGLPDEVEAVEELAGGMEARLRVTLGGGA